MAVPKPITVRALTEDDEVRLLRIDEVAQRIGCTGRHVRALISRGDMPAVELPRSPGAKTAERRVRITDLKAWMDRLAESA